MVARARLEGTTLPVNLNARTMMGRLTMPSLTRILASASAASNRTWTSVCCRFAAPVPKNQKAREPFFFGALVYLVPSRFPASLAGCVLARAWAARVPA